MDAESVYHAGMRELQDLRDTRRLANRLATVTMHGAFTDEDRLFIQRCRMLCIATADEHGSPDCSYKGGGPGFVQVLGEDTLGVPDYDGNGMYRTWGNVLVNPQVGLLFLDFENQKRMRVNGTARISHDPALCAQFPGAVFVVLVTAQRIFPNCPRYLHRMQLVEESVHVPRPGYIPPVPAWKTSDQFRDALPQPDRGDTT
jgi:predicted pyridoxine 5'-phosphate oxidase superfamily flavin-nucleotide-binding protein